jgi:hypothetical protein
MQPRGISVTNGHPSLSASLPDIAEGDDGSTASKGREPIRS